MINIVRNPLWGFSFWLQFTKKLKSVNIMLIKYMNYSKLIKEYREKRFLSQRDLATELGVSFVTINRWETGKFNPTIKMKKRLFILFKEAGLLEV